MAELIAVTFVCCQTPSTPVTIKKRRISFTRTSWTFSDTHRHANALLISTVTKYPGPGQCKRCSHSQHYTHQKSSVHPFGLRRRRRGEEPRYTFTPPRVGRAMLPNERCPAVAPTPPPSLLLAPRAVLPPPVSCPL